MRDDADVAAEPFAVLEARLTPPAAPVSKKQQRQQRHQERWDRLWKLWQAGERDRLVELGRSWLTQGVLPVETMPGSWPTELAQLLRDQLKTSKRWTPPAPVVQPDPTHWWHKDCAGMPKDERILASTERLHARAGLSGTRPEVAWTRGVREWMIEQAGLGCDTSQAALVAALHAAHPELPTAVWRKALSEERQERTQQAAAERAKEAARVLLNPQQTADRLGVPVSKVKAWTHEGVLRPYRHKAFYKWGKTLQTALYDQEAVDAFVRQRVHCQGSSSLAAIVASPSEALWVAVRARGGEAHPKGMTLPWVVNEKGWMLQGLSWLPLPTLGPGQMAETVVMELQERLQRAVTRHFQRFLVLVRSEPVASELFWHHLKERMSKESWAPVSLLAWEQSKCDGRRAWMNKYQQHRRALIVEHPSGEGLLALAEGRYPDLFPQARAMKRCWKAVLGPTNSGKTHRALEALAQAGSGVYLAPLRLLAHEVAERLNAQGIPCDLVTGEEVVRVPGARHVAATIEAGWSERAVDVAVIDEVQMMGDAERGWAWVQALVGTVAEEIWCVGSTSAEGALKEMARRLGEDLDVVRLERKGGLACLPQPVTQARIQAGDALIAFSRAEVLQWRETLRQQGHAVACVYGALGPEVRRAEAERFRSGEAKVLVATDAIGMGLNLPIQRVLFTTLVKFDGVTERCLETGEIQQIAGRAGRFGLHEAGEVGMLAPSHQGNVEKIRQALARATPEVAHERFLVQPNWAAMKQILDGIGVKATLEQGLRAFFQIIVRSPGYRCGYGHDVLHWAERLPGTKLGLQEQFAVLGCPVGRAIEDTVLEWLTDQAHGEANWGKDISRQGWSLTSRGSLQTPQDLQAAETVAQLASAYRWLALRYPNSYPGGEEVARLCQALHPAIAQALAKQTLQRRCSGCGSRKMPANLRFDECEACYQQRRSRRARMDDWDDDL